MNLRKISTLTIAAVTALTLVSGCAPVYDRGVIVEKQYYNMKPFKYCFYIEDPETKKKGECLEVSDTVYDSYEEGDFYPRKGDK